MCPAQGCDKHYDRPCQLLPHVATDHSEFGDKKIIIYNPYLDPHTHLVTFLPGSRGPYPVSDPKYHAAGRAAKRKQSSQAFKAANHYGRGKRAQSASNAAASRLQCLQDSLLQGEIDRRKEQTEHRQEAQQTNAQLLKVLEQVVTANAALVDNNKMVVENNKMVLAQNQQLALQGGTNRNPHMQVAPKRLDSPAAADLANRKL